jgi:hypothetical protein
MRLGPKEDGRAGRTAAKKRDAGGLGVRCHARETRGGDGVGVATLREIDGKSQKPQQRQGWSFRGKRALEPAVLGIGGRAVLGQWTVTRPLTGTARS